MIDSPTADAAEATAAVQARFDTLPLDPKLLRAVADSGYEWMTPIQAKAIPLVLAGRDIMGAAQTGTGKTAAFTIPLLQKMLRHENNSMSPARHPVRALVIAPTRELADQVAASVDKYAKHTLLRSMVVFGGVDIKPQTAELRKGVEVLVATPGRLLDHIEAKTAILNQVEYVVLDEADRMLDIGFLPDLQRILSYLPKERQTLLFSATFSPEIKRLAASYLQDPLTVEVARPNATASTVEQHFYSVTDDDKRSVVRQILRERELSPAIVFVNSKLGAARQARAGHRRPARGLQLRRALQRRGLRAPHRPHRPRRRLGAGGDAGHARRRAQHRRHREADQEEDRVRALRTRRRPAASCAPAQPRPRRRSRRAWPSRRRQGRAARPGAEAARRPDLRPALRAECCHATLGARPRARTVGQRPLAEHPIAAQGRVAAGRREVLSPATQVP